MDPSPQDRIDRVRWYHEFDFGDGLRARSPEPDVAAHRRIWRFLERQCEAIDFRGKSVLEVGCWDGYWSFLAERTGARTVLATDDQTQNWSNGEGIRLARELLHSAVETRQDVSIYRLSELGRTFDVVLCFGVYYHLLDPVHAFAQLRHCCHRGSVVLLDGDVGIGLGTNEVRHSFGDSCQPAFLPSASALRNLLKSAYLDVRSQAYLGSPRGVKALLKRVVRGRRAAVRVFTVCAPFAGVNVLHPYEPPFGLGRYDPRFRDTTRAAG
jgi:tRNA (mo5U34)-methyltransferase